MSRLRIVFVAALAVASVAVMTAPVGAAVPASNTKFCSAFKKIGHNDNGGSSLTASGAKSTLANFKAAAKAAPPKVKSAANEIVSVLSKVVGNPKAAAELAQSSEAKKYGSSIATFFQYAEQQCAGITTPPTT